MLTQDEFLKNYQDVKSAMDKAEEDVTPFAVVNDSKLSVIGDPNKTQVKQNDYVLTFRFPPSMNVEGRKTARGIEVDMTFKDIFIKPRDDMDIVRLLVNILPYFRKVEEDGTVTELGRDDIFNIIGSLSDEIINAMVDLVAKVCGVDERLKDYITPLSVMQTVAKIIGDFPELENEADTFFE